MNRLIITVVVFGLMQLGLQAQTDWYVDQTSVLGGNGSLANPFPTIQPAVAAAATGDTIHVFPGNYGGLIDFAGKGLKLVSTGGKAVTKIRGSASFGNSEIKIHGTVNDLAHLEGFTFDAGTGTTMKVNVSNSSLVVKDCDFPSKGIEIQNSLVDLQIENCIFDSGSIIQTLGVGSPLTPSGTATIKNSEFRNQSYFNVDYGSAYGINMKVASLLVDGCVFDDCGTGIQSYSTTTTIKNSILEHNLGRAAILTHGLIENCVIHDSEYGISVYGSVQFDNCDFTQCGLYVLQLSSASASFKDCRIKDNGTFSYSQVFHATFGGAVELEGCHVENNWGADLSTGLNSVSMRNTVLAHNTGRLFSLGTIEIEHGSLYGNTPASGTLIQSLQPALIVDSILWSNTGSIVPASTLIVNSNIQGGWAGPGSANIDIDPLFVDPMNGDFHLQPTSPMIDRGTAVSLGASELDIDGDARVIGRYSDIGADELDSGAFALRGTDEDFTMITKINLARVNGLAVDVVGGDLVSLTVSSPGADFVGAPVYVFGEVFTTGGSPILPVGHPQVHMNLLNADLLFDPAIAAGLPGWSFGLPSSGLSLSGPVPFGFSGVSYRIQAFAVWPLAANGWYAATDAVDLLHP